MKLKDTNNLVNADLIGEQLEILNYDMFTDMSRVF